MRDSEGRTDRRKEGTKEERKGRWKEEPKEERKEGQMEGRTDGRKEGKEHCMASGPDRTPRRAVSGPRAACLTPLYYSYPVGWIGPLGRPTGDVCLIDEEKTLKMLLICDLRSCLRWVYVHQLFDGLLCI